MEQLRAFSAVGYHVEVLKKRIRELRQNINDCYSIIESPSLESWDKRL